MAEDKHSQDEWREYLSGNENEIIIRFAKSSVQTMLLQTDDIPTQIHLHFVYNPHITQKRLADIELNQEDDIKQEDTAPDDGKEQTSSAFGWLCVILKLFGSLNVDQFLPIIVEHTFQNIYVSLQKHASLSTQDCVNRLELILWILINSKCIGLPLEMRMILNLCDILNRSDLANVIDLASKALIFAVSRRHKSHIKETLLSIQTTLSSDAFRHFTEFYFKILTDPHSKNGDDDDDSNGSQNEVELELLLEFNCLVFRHRFHSFFFKSDIQELIQFYLRSFNDADPSSKRLLFSLDGLYSIIRWKQYGAAEGLNQYKLNELMEALTEGLQKTVKESYAEYKEQFEGDDDQKQNDSESSQFTKREIGDIMTLIRTINTKIGSIVETLRAIESSTFDYDQQMAVELPIDISEYALKTKTMLSIQRDILEFIYFLETNINSEEEWIAFLTADNNAVYKRLCTLIIRCLQNEQKWFKALLHQNVDDVVQSESEYAVDPTQLLPLSAVCQLLVALASLKPPEFGKMIRLRILNPLRASLKNTLRKEDVMARLQVLLFLMEDTTFVMGHEWFLVLCGLLQRRDDDKEDDILVAVTKCIAFFIGKMNGDEKMRDKQKGHLLHLQSGLQNKEDFTHFVELYIRLVNEIRIEEWNTQTHSTRSLVTFVMTVMDQQLKDFFYVSDVKVLIAVYLRCLDGMDMYGEGFILCLEAISSLFKWEEYQNEGNPIYKFKYAEICSVLSSRLQNVKDNETLTEALKTLLSIKL